MKALNPTELALVVRRLGLSTSDLAELGGVRDRQAHRWLSGVTPLPVEVARALWLLRRDQRRLAELYRDWLAMVPPDPGEGPLSLPVYRDNTALRLNWPTLPAEMKALLVPRGLAAGGFAAIQQGAAFDAVEALWRPADEGTGEAGALAQTVVIMPFSGAADRS